MTKSELILRLAKRYPHLYKGEGDFLKTDIQATV